MTGPGALHWLDVVVLIVIGLSVIGGLFRGLAREVAGLAGVVLGFVLAFAFAPAWSHHLERWMVPPAAYAVLFVLVLMGTMLVADLLGRLVTKLLDAVLLSVPNRLAGGLFGALRGALLAVALFMGVLFFSDDPARVLRESRLAPYAAQGARIVLRWLPEAHRLHLQDRLPDRRV